MNNLNGLKVCLDQMKVVPGRPDLNSQYIIEQTCAAAQRGIDVIVFPEMAMTGYFIGDKLENRSFVNDVISFNKDICKASIGITVVFGSITLEKELTGEDGRHRISNSAIIATNGYLVGEVSKTLQPNYRYFNDDKHLYSNRETAAWKGVPVEDLLKPLYIKTKIGQVNLGVILCEDMWHLDYPVNPTEVLVKKGAELVLNLSASPWGWQKNRKRHQVVKNLLQQNPVPFIYVNNTGVQNTGKNVLVFDGSSTVYDSAGEIIHEVLPYVDGASDFEFKEVMHPIVQSEKNDTAELYAAMRCVTKEYFATMPSYRRRAILGLSGGIDSAVVAALLVDVLGPKNVFTVNMPSKYNSEETKEFAERISENLGISYEIHPIDAIADEICMTSPRAIPGSLAFENVQARARMNILAVKAQADYGCIYTSNCNKVELAFGYGTLYADLAGYLAPLTDLIKKEVREVAEYLNAEVFRREVIPQGCIDQAPAAELAENQRDPFDYGTVNRRGYHDELVRALVEFGHDPEWVLEEYIKGTLESKMGLEIGTLNKLFRTPIYFLRDLEKHWGMFGFSYVKRVQAPPVPVFSKRAFGRDYEESIMSTYLTKRYLELRALIVNRYDPIPLLAIFGGSFNPPGKHHRIILEQLSKQFDKVIVAPCGLRPDKESLFVSPEHRAAMIESAFGDLPNVEVDLFDINSELFTPTYQIDKEFKDKFPDYDIWHVVGGDLVQNGGTGNCQIQTSWKRGWELWDRLNFAVITHSGMPVDYADFPPHAQSVECSEFHGRATEIRQLLQKGESAAHLLDSKVEDYILNNGLYRF